MKTVYFRRYNDLEPTSKMKSKDWKEELRVMFPLVSLEDLLDVTNFISTLLEEARKEGEQIGYENCLSDIWEEARALRSWTEHDGSVSANDVEAGIQEAYRNIEERFDLTSKEDKK